MVGTKAYIPLIFVKGYIFIWKGSCQNELTVIGKKKLENEKALERKSSKEEESSDEGKCKKMSGLSLQKQNSSASLLYISYIQPNFNITYHVYKIKDKFSTESQIILVHSGCNSNILCKLHRSIECVCISSSVETFIIRVISFMAYSMVLDNNQMPYSFLKYAMLYIDFQSIFSQIIS